MTARTVVGTVVLPGGVVPAHATVMIELVASTTGRAIGWVPTADLGIAGRRVLECDTNGAWTVDLRPNTLISPSGTYYRLTYTASSDTQWSTTFTIVVPDSAGPHRVEDILDPAVTPVSIPALQAHIDDTTAAHAASAVSFTPTGTIAATTVQAAVAEVASEAGTALADHLADTADAHDASAISFSPTLAITATDVQAALANAAGDRSQVATDAGRRNIVAGHVLNAIAADVHAATIIGGGQTSRENVIGAATTANVGTDTSNLPTAPGTVANYSAILGGYDNVANGLMSMIGGAHNYTESASTHGSIGGGSFNAITAGDYSTIVGGTFNTISGSNSVVGGRNNTVSSSDATVFGKDITVNAGADGSIALGTQHVINAQGFAIGVDCIVDGVSATAIGRRSRSRTYGQFSQAADYFAVEGDAQSSVLTLRRETTNATEAVCGATGASNSHVLLAKQVVGYQIVLVAREDATGDCKMWTIAGAMKRPATGNNTHVGGSAPTPVVVAADAGAAAWTCRVDISTNILVLRVTGEAGKTIRWCARMELAEVGTL